MTAVTVFDGAHLRAVLFGGGADRMIVTFDHRRSGREGFPAATASAGFARRGFSQLAVGTRANDWYVNADTPALEAALRGVAGACGDVRCLGYSMGGYAALRYAGAMGARQAVVVSPQVSIAPSAAPWEGRYRGEARGWDAGLGDLAGRAGQSLRGLLVVDPFVEADRLHALAIAALFPALRIVRLGHGGHPATGALRDAGTGWVIGREAGQDEADARAVHAAHRAARRASRGYWERLANHAGTRRPALAAKAAKAAAGLGGGAGPLDPPEDSP